MNDTQKELEFVNRRFDRDARAFNAIYSDDGGIILKWFNKNFRKPIFERFDLAFSLMGDLHGKSVIDVGCGSGIYLVNLVKRGANKVLGVDFSSEMLALAKDKLAKLTNHSHFDLQKANFLDLNPPEKFNFSLAMGVFDYQPEPISFLQKLREVTSDKVIASFPGHSIIRKPLRKLRYRLTSRGNVYYYTQPELEWIAKKAGFTKYEIINLKTGSGFILVGYP